MTKNFPNSSKYHLKWINRAISSTLGMIKQYDEIHWVDGFFRGDTGFQSILLGKLPFRKTPYSFQLPKAKRQIIIPYFKFMNDICENFLELSFLMNENFIQNIDIDLNIINVCFAYGRPKDWLNHFPD